MLSLLFCKTPGNVSIQRWIWPGRGGTEACRTPFTKAKPVTAQLWQDSFLPLFFDTGFFLQRSESPCPAIPLHGLAQLVFSPPSLLLLESGKSY